MLLYTLILNIKQAAHKSDCLAMKKDLFQSFWRVELMPYCIINGSLCSIQIIRYLTQKRKMITFADILYYLPQLLILFESEVLNNFPTDSDFFPPVFFSSLFLHNSHLVKIFTMEMNSDTQMLHMWLKYEQGYFNFSVLSRRIISSISSKPY